MKTDWIEDEDTAHVVEAVRELKDSVDYGLKKLGLADAHTRLGAIELLAREVKQGSERIARAVHDLAEAMRG